MRESCIPGLAGHVRTTVPRIRATNPSCVTRRDRSPGRPHPDLELTNMCSFSDWKITVLGRGLCTSDSPYRLRAKILKRLVGRRLLGVQINPLTQATTPMFTRHIVLSTVNMQHTPASQQHWLLRRSSDVYQRVMLKGLAAGRHGESACH